MLGEGLFVDFPGVEVVELELDDILYQNAGAAHLLLMSDRGICERLG